MTQSELDLIRKTPFKGSHSWAYNNYNRYDNFLERMDMSAKTVHKYANDCFRMFNQAQDNDFAYMFYNNISDNKITVGTIHQRFDDFEKWTLLNKLLAVNCYFENYLYMILKLSFDSSPNLIDNSYTDNGVLWLKYGIPSCINPDSIDKKTKKLIDKCVIGNWQQRMDNLKAILEITDISLINAFNSIIRDLDAFREVRVSVGHFFGREERIVHDWYNTEIPNFTELTVDSFLDWQKKIHKFVEELDRYIMKTYVGSYQELCFYHKNRLIIDNYDDLYLKCNKFKILLLQEKKGQGPYNAKFLANIIKYYNEI